MSLKLVSKAWLSAEKLIMVHKEIENKIDSLRREILELEGKIKRERKELRERKHQKTIFAIESLPEDAKTEANVLREKLRQLEKRRGLTVALERAEVQQRLNTLFDTHDTHIEWSKRALINTKAEVDILEKKLTSLVPFSPRAESKSVPSILEDQLDNPQLIILFGEDGRAFSYLYKNGLYSFSAGSPYALAEQKLLIKEHYYKQEKRFEKLRKEVQLFEKLETSDLKSREPIPEEVRFAVWRRDDGHCVKCGSNKNLEFDHIIPVSKGGSNTERNIQLLCLTCNREKSNNI